MSSKNIPNQIILFSQRLQSAMRTKGLNQKQLAELATTEQGTISKYLRGLVIAPDSNILKRISEVLDVSMDWLLGKETEKNNNYARQIAAAGQPPADQPPVEYEKPTARSPQAANRLAATINEARLRIDRQLLSDIIILLEDVCEDRRLKLPAALKGQMISLLYEIHQDTAKPVTRQTVIAFLDFYV